MNSYAFKVIGSPANRAITVSIEANSVHEAHMILDFGYSRCYSEYLGMRENLTLLHNKLLPQVNPS